MLTLPAAAPLVSVTATRNDEVVFCACTGPATITVRAATATNTDNELSFGEILTSFPSNYVVNIISPQSIAQ